MDFRNTLNLPDADAAIPMKANLPQLEPAIQQIWSDNRIYHRLQLARQEAPTFVLHDGPPYTNSPIHMGTAMNKVLKDMVVKSRLMMGFRTPYVPGFDNHGLPIEQAVVKKFAELKVTPTPKELRQACRAHAENYIKIQSEQFQRLGVLGLWEKPYKTMDFRYEAGIVRTFKRLVEAGLVYKGLRPTLWSPTSKTALADTEIVYREDHKSTAIYVRFPLGTDPNRLFDDYPNLSTIIWTTTPWTIPANLACAFHPEVSYAIVDVRDSGDTPDGHYLIAEPLVEKVAAELGWTSFAVVKTLEGINFENVTFHHPIFGRPSLAVMAEYVTTEDGTGVVHTAPSHGRDDFFTGQKYDLGVPNTVDENGVLTAETGEFAGTFYKKCDTVVVDRLREENALLKASTLVHSYPYAERDDQPVIFRATEQWFVAINPLREQMLEEIQNIPLDDYTQADQTPVEESPSALSLDELRRARHDMNGVSWVPEGGFNRIEAMVRNRPDWCISRQRPWGVGIPVFYGKTSRVPVLDPVAIEAVALLVEREGSDAWWEHDAAAILPEGYVHPETGETEFVKETDTLDVWFDSGSSSLNVLEGKVEPEWGEHYPADLYLEGSDQHRGWFNTSLILGVACRGQAPYRQVVTHGFIVDEKGQKMSKRLGNVIDPVKACHDHGADVIRYWVAGVDWSNDAPCYDALLKQFGEGYRNIRNTLRFLMSNLTGYELAATPETLLPLDEWIIEQTDLLVADAVQAYERYDFGTVINGVHNFCRELSAFYLDVVKDRMYCEHVESVARRSGQTACYQVLVRLVKLVAPILSHTAEESWRKLHEVMPSAGHAVSVFEEIFEVPSRDRLAEIEGSDLQVSLAAVLSLRSSLNSAISRWREGSDPVSRPIEGLHKAAEVGSTVLTELPDGNVSWTRPKDTQDLVIYARVPGSTAEAIHLTFKSLEELATLLKVSAITLTPISDEEPSFDILPSPYQKCERSRLRRADVTARDLDGESVILSARDFEVVAILRGQG